MEAGFDLDIRRPPLGDPLPETLTDHAGAVIFGGPMSANDGEEFVRRETDWLAVPLKEKRPFLGICLGAQMLVNHLGGKVEGRHDGVVEIGWYPLKRDGGGQGADALAGNGLSVPSRGFFAAFRRDAARHRRNLSEPGLPLRRQRLGHPVPCRADAGDDASLGGARRATLRTSGRPAGPRSPRRPHDLGYAAEALADRFLETVRPGRKTADHRRRRDPSPARRDAGYSATWGTATPRCRRRRLRRRRRTRPPVRCRSPPPWCRRGIRPVRSTRRRIPC